MRFLRASPTYESGVKIPLIFNREDDRYCFDYHKMVFAIDKKVEKNCTLDVRRTLVQTVRSVIINFFST